MKKILDVNTGEVKVTSRQVLLRSTAIGSCIVIAAYDAKSKTGALAHVMLPGKAPGEQPEKTKYAEDAIDRMIAKMTRSGSNSGDIEACLVGAGNVLKREDETICEENIQSVTRLLGKKRIPIRAVALGGTQRKAVLLDVETGAVFYTEGDQKETLLFRSK